MQLTSILKIVFLSVAMLLLAACDGGEQSNSSSKPTMPKGQVVVLDARGQDVYDTNCKVCHGLPNSGAPQSGQLSDWQERSAKGMDTMLNNVMDGVQAMPAMGGCFDCTENDFRQLITFMTSGILK